MLGDPDFHHVGYVVPNTEAVGDWQACGYEIERDWIFDENQNVLCSLLTKDGELRVELLAPPPNRNKHPLTSVLKRGGGFTILRIL